MNFQSILIQIIPVPSICTTKRTSSDKILVSSLLGKIKLLGIARRFEKSGIKSKCVTRSGFTRGGFTRGGNSKLSSNRDRNSDTSVTISC